MGTVSVWDNKRVLETDGDGCTIMRMYLMPLNYTRLKMVKIGHVYFITIKKIVYITYVEAKLKTILYVSNPVRIFP